MLSIDKEAGKIGLSIRATEEAPEDALSLQDQERQRNGQESRFRFQVMKKHLKALIP